MQNLNHHAYLIIGKKEQGEKEVLKFLKEAGVKTKSNPDLFSFNFDRMYVDDARTIVEIENKSPVSLDFKYITINLQSIVWEAQNTLLKIFEDPNRSKFFVIAESKSQFLPTLLSRFQIIYLPKEKNEASNGKRFLNLSYAMRLKEVGNLTKSISDGEKSHKDARDLLLDIRSNLQKTGEIKPSVLHSLKYISDTSSSTKLLLESVVLSV